MATRTTLRWQYLLISRAFGFFKAHDSTLLVVDETVVLRQQLLSPHLHLIKVGCWHAHSASQCLSSTQSSQCMGNEHGTPTSGAFRCHSSSSTAAATIAAATTTYDGLLQLASQEVVQLPQGLLLRRRFPLRPDNIREQ